jgi:hypothetical protein
MKMHRLLPVLLLLAIAGATHAQDAGPGMMMDELSSMSDASLSKNATAGVPQRAPHRTHASQSDGSHAGLGLKGVFGRKDEARTSPGDGMALNGAAVSSTQGIDGAMAEHSR